MAPTRKNPVHPMAAMLGDVHPSPATWVRFTKTSKGEIQISAIGQFVTGFRSDNNRCFSKLRAEFRTVNVHPYFGQEHWAYTPSDLGLMPVETLNWYRDYDIAPPTEWEASQRFQRPVVRDLRDPYSFWESIFIVKIQHAHKVLGCTPEEFRRIHLAKFYDLIANEAADLFWAEEEDARRNAEEESALA